MNNKELYIWVLDFEIGEVLRYNITGLKRGDYQISDDPDELKEWNPDYESCEAFLYGAGHNPANIEWMVTSNDKIIKR